MSAVPSPNKKPGGKAMQIVLIEDEAGTLAALAYLLRHMGHLVQEFVDPRQALANLSEKTDLVVSAVTKPTLGGLDVVKELCTNRRNPLPRVLLMTEGDHQGLLTAYPPSILIGILPKPFCLADFSQTISQLAQTRTQCSGTIGSFCSHVYHGRQDRDGTAKQGRLCFTSEYATCPHYDAECGQAFRHGIRGLFLRQTKTKGVPMFHDGVNTPIALG
jgi:CheY-like chemotaxis protein